MPLSKLVLSLPESSLFEVEGDGGRFLVSTDGGIEDVHSKYICMFLCS
jgi:hypothetical protein